MSGNGQRIFEFDGFRLETEERRLSKDGRPVPLASRTFDLLLALVKGNGHLLTKEELYQSVWADRIVEESNLSVQISAIRKALGESDHGPHYIDTVKGHGYRFVADVKRADDVRDEIVVESETFSRLVVEHEEVGVADLQVAGHRRSRNWVLVTAGLMIVVASLAAYIWWPDVGASSEPFEASSIRRLTTSGNAAYGAISPDGKLFVYSLSEKAQFSLWLGHTSGESSPVLLRALADSSYASLSFLSDSNRFYYVQTGVREWKGVLYRSPALGGVPEKLRENVPARIAFAPDDERFAFVRNDEGTGNSTIVIADVKGTVADREIASRPLSHAFRPGSLAWSRDGSMIALGGLGDDGSGSEIFAVSVATGSVRQITTSDWRDINATAWMKNGRDLLAVGLAENSAEIRKLWHVSAESGEVRPVGLDFHGYGLTLSLSADDGELLVLQAQSAPNVWLAPSEDLRQAKQVTFGSRRDGWISLDWMPNGKLVFGATGEGGQSIWTMNADGSDPQPLTSTGHVDEKASVTADGKTIVFESNCSGSQEIWRIESDGSGLRQLTSGRVSTEPHVSPDGRWIVYTGGSGTLWRLPSDGGEPFQLTSNVATWARFSPDSHFVACEYHIDDGMKLAVIPINGGQPIKLFDVPKSANFRYGIRWMPDAQALAYRDWFNGIWKQPLAGGEPSRLEGLPEEKLFAYDWSRDGKQFAFVRGDEVLDLILLER
jgi:DNA-binding winged helix-turn-helix (wHTH) protein/Tol biopolymer transport system component